MTVTVALACALPPLPLQVSVYVLLALRAPVPADPAVDLLPLQAPEAAQPVAYVLDQVSVLPLPLVTDAGEALRVTVGAGVLPVFPDPLLPPEVRVGDDAAPPDDGAPADGLDVPLLPDVPAAGVLPLADVALCGEDALA